MKSDAAACESLTWFFSACNRFLVGIILCAWTSLFYQIALSSYNPRWSNISIKRLLKFYINSLVRTYLPLPLKFLLHSTLKSEDAIMLQ